MDECFSMEGFEGPVVKIEPEDEWTEHSDSISESRVGNEAQAPLQSETVVKEEITDTVPSDVSSGEESEDNAGMDPDTFKTFVKEEMEAAPGGLKPKSEDEPGPSGIADVKQEDLSGAEAGTDEEMYDSEEESDTDMYTEGLSEGQAIKTENQEPSVKEESVENLSEGASNLTLPEGLCIRKMKRDGVGEAVEGVWSTKMLTKGTVFGPYATQASSTATKTGMATSSSSWIAFIRESSQKAWSNIEALRIHGGLSLVTTINLKPGTELIQPIDLVKLREIKVAPGLKAFRCPDCGDSFTSLGQLMNHFIKHKDNKFNRCSDCGQYFSQYLLKAHRLSHADESLEKLQRKIQRRRLEKCYFCPDCGKGFTQSCNMKNHRLVHTEKKLYDCPICGKYFLLSKGLKNHMRIHSEIKHQCSECEMSFYRPSHLANHRLVHTGEKTHKCSACGASFARLYHLAIHIRKAHGHTWEKT